MKCTPHAVAAATLSLPAALASFAATADVFDVEFESPTLDRWMYPFNTDPGNKPDAPVFGAVGSADFDDRDGQFIIGFDVAQQVPAGQGADRYRIIDATVRVANMVTSDVNTILYDPTYDPWQTYLEEDDQDFQPDSDPGRPVSLFGTGYRNGFTIDTFFEDSPYSTSGPPGEGIRNAYALAFDADGPFDASNNVRHGFDVFPFAVGETGIEPGEPVPGETDFVFSLDLNNPDVVRYLQQSLDIGTLNLTIATLHFATERGGEGSSFPRFYTKENALSDFFDYEARLFMTVEIVPAGTPAEITGFEVVTGSLIEGDVDDLRESDDSVVRTQSGFGRTFIDLHNMEMVIDAVSSVDSPANLDLSVEARIDEPVGQAELSLRNWNTGEFDVVARYAIGETEDVFNVNDLDAGAYVSETGAIELSVKHIVFVPIFAFTFESFIDEVSFIVE